MLIVAFTALALDKQGVMQQIDIAATQLEKLTQPDGGAVERLYCCQPEPCGVKRRTVAVLHFFLFDVVMQYFA